MYFARVYAMSVRQMLLRCSRYTASFWGTLMKNRALHLLLIGSLSSLGAVAQINCAQNSPAASKLVCQIPFSTGVYGNQGSTQVPQAALQTAAVFNTAIATAVSQLPLASSSSGTVVLYRAGVPQTYNNLGPILTDRASTIGRHHLFLSFTASQFFFTDVDGLNLHKLPFSY